MPCYQVNLVSQVFQAKHLTVLKKAAESLKWSFQQTGDIVYVGGMIIDLKGETITGRDINRMNLLKRKYTEQGMKKFAKKFGWQVQKEKENQYILAKF